MTKQKTTQNIFTSGVVFLLPIFFLVSLLIFGLPAQGQDKKVKLEVQIAEIEVEISALDDQLAEVQRETQTLENAVFRLNTEIKRSELTIRGLNLSITNTESQITFREIAIDETQANIDKRKASLAEYLRTFYKYTERSLIEIILSTDISQFFQEISVLEELQENAQDSLNSLRILKANLENERQSLREKREDFAGLKVLAQIEKQNLNFQKGQKDELLRITKGQEAVFQQIISGKQRNIAAIRSQIFYLEQTGITAEEAIKFAELAASRTGIRTAFLLGLLEVETGRRFADNVITAGSNLGTGNWKTDLYDCYISLGKPKTAEYHKNAFFSITSKLGLDPDAMAVSRKPSYGCGGAMGPAQFLPGTWVLFEDRVVKLTGHNPPNPWVIDDAFTASALYLADAGATAKTKVGETRAAKAYISGSPSCSRYICNFYAREVLRVANLIDQNL